MKLSEMQLSELSPETLASYKKKAGAQARDLDKSAFDKETPANVSKQQIQKANKRFSGIVRATKKELEKDLEEGQIYFQGGGGPEAQHYYEPRRVPNQNELDKKVQESAILKGMQNEDELDENLRKWFKEKWVRFGPDGKIRGACARGDDSEGKPKCLPQSKAHSLGKKGRASAAARKRREDPNPERRGPAKNVATKKKTNEQELDEACWKGYHKEGNKKMFGKTYPNCVKNTNEELDIEEDRENFNGINLLLQKDDDEVFVKASAGGKELGHVLFVIDGEYLMPQDLEVEERYRGQGIAKTMYDFVKSKGYKIRRSGQQTDAGAGFWAKHRPEQNVWEAQHSGTCPHCGGEMVSEELMNEKKDACYYKVKSRYKVWPSAYASGALVKCRKKGAKNWGNKSESIEETLGTPYPGTYEQETAPIKSKGQKRTQSIAFEAQELEEKWSQKYKRSINCNNPKGFSQRAHCQGRKKNESMSNILQGIILTEEKTYKLWESAGRKLVEAELTADQIKDLFQQVEQGATSAGSNRTLIGKGKDAASAVNQAWEDLKTKVQSSGPIKNVDAMYDQAAEKLKQATGGDQGVMKYVQMYRDFAKKHPVAQGLIYSALIAAAGISGAGLGGAAALGLFKMVDKLLQGEKFSSAAYSGAKTGAMAYGASKVGDLIRGKPEGVSTPSAAQGSDAAITAVQAVRQEAGDIAVKAIEDAIKSGQIKPDMVNNAAGIARAAIEQYGTNVGGELNLTTLDAIANRAAMIVAQKSSAMNEAIELNEATIKVLFSKISLEQTKQINEGVMDWLKTKGKNLTTKVTADKLMSAWKKAGSPTDSQAISQIIKSAGVDDTVIKGVYDKMSLPYTPAAAPTATPTATPSATPTPTGAGAPTTQTATPSTTPTATGADSSTVAPSTTTGTTPKETPLTTRIERAFATLTPTQQAKLLRKLQGSQAPGTGAAATPKAATPKAATPKAATPKAATQKSSTGGTITKTPTGIIHKGKGAKPQAPKTPTPKPKAPGAGAFGQMASQLGGRT